MFIKESMMMMMMIILWPR